MSQQLDLMEVISVLTQTMLDYRTRITELEAKTARQDEQTRVADLDIQTQKVASASKVHPKTRRVVFAGRNYFGDNIKYAFLDFVHTATKNDCDVRFLPPDETQEAFLKYAGLPYYPCDFRQWTAADVRSALETSVAVHCDHDVSWKWKDPRIRAFFAGARQVQMWHGISIKELGLKFVHGGDAFGMLDCDVLETSGKFDVFVGTSRRSEAEWRRFFIFDRYEPLGYPRNDALLREATTHDLINVDLNAYERVQKAHAENRPVYLYAPTFRDNIGPAWFPPPGLMELFAGPLAQKTCLIVNLHPFEQKAIPELESQYPQVHFIRQGTDLYPVLRYADALITDYSSLMFDYLLLDRPIVLYRPDHERYQAQSRALFDQKIAVPPGPVCHTTDELARALEGLLHGEDPAAANRRHLRQTWFDYPDAGSSSRMTKIIFGLLPSASAADQRRAV